MGMKVTTNFLKGTQVKGLNQIRVLDIDRVMVSAHDAKIRVPTNSLQSLPGMVHPTS